MTDLEKQLLEACQIALMNVEMNTREHELQLTKIKLRNAIKAAGGEFWEHPQAWIKSLTKERSA